MKFGEYIQDQRVFTIGQVQEAFGRSQNTNNLLNLALRSGKIKRVRRGLYVSNTGRFKGVSASPLVVAAASRDDAVLCHAGAFALFSGSQDVVYEVAFYTAKRMGAFSFEGFRYLPLRLPNRRLDVKDHMMADGSRIRATSKEQTIADALSKPGLSGGAESVLRRLSVIEFVNAEKIVECARDIGVSCCARLGWVLSRCQARWAIDDRLIGELSSSIGAGPYYFDGGRNRDQFDERWRLYLPERPKVMEEWLDG